MIRSDKNPSEIYTFDWFKQHYDQEHEYRAIGKLLHDTFGMFDATDIGCGVGIIIDELSNLGHDVIGFDGSRWAKLAAKQSIGFRIHTTDVTRWKEEILLADAVPRKLVICTEVAEHLEWRHAETLVELLSHICDEKGHIFFTAALPGQGGHDHVNEQPNSYWIAMFADRGRSFQTDLTMTMRRQLRELCPLMNFLARTTMVFR